MDNIKVLNCSSGYDDHRLDLPYLLRKTAGMIRDYADGNYIESAIIQRDTDEDGLNYTAKICYEAKGSRDE